MRLDDLPESGNVEDRRSEGGLGGGAVAACHRRRRAGHRHRRGARPGRLGAGHRSEPADRRRRSLTARASRKAAADGAPHRQAADDTGASSTGARQHRGAMERDLCQGGPDLSCAGARALPRPDRARLRRHGPERDGPVLLPGRPKIYLDTSFFRQIGTRFRGCDASGKSCQFSQAYVIAHEVGHHVQNLLGILPRRSRPSGRPAAGPTANQHPGAVELQADCLAGVWANQPTSKGSSIQPGDVEAALRTAAAIGDDTLQRQRRATWCPTASPMAARSSASAGSRPASRRERRRPATRSRRG